MKLPSADTLEQVARTTLVVVLLALVVITGLVIIRRSLRGWLARREQRLLASSRPLLMSIVTADRLDPEAVARLATIRGREWRACEPTLVSMLAKVRGGSHAALVEVLVRRGTIERAVRRTRSWSLIARCEAAELIGATGYRPAAPALIRLLDDRSPEVRRVAARAVGRLGDPAGAVPLLRAGTGDRALPSRDVAAALVLLDAEATPTLVSIVAEQRSPLLRSIGAEVLGLRGAVEAVGLLVSMLREDPSLEVRIRASRALGRIGVDTAVGPLVDALDAEATELRAVAARALGQVGSDEAVPALVVRLGDPAHRVAANAAESLAALGDRGLLALGEAAASERSRAGDYAREALALHRLGRRPLDRQAV